MKKLRIAIYCLVALVLAAIVAAGCYFYRRNHVPVIDADEEVLSTDSRMIHKVLEEPELIVREWTNVENPQWHKVYYDDPAEDAAYCWGKEWNEADEVKEEDLLWHGNGWFIWQLRGDNLIEIHQMENHAGNAVVLYHVNSLSASKFVYSDVNERLQKTYTFQ